MKTRCGTTLLSGGGVEVRAAHDGGRFLQQRGDASPSSGRGGASNHFSPRFPSSSPHVLEVAEAPQHADIVRCLEIDASSGLAASASGSDVVVWALGRPVLRHDDGGDGGESPSSPYVSSHYCSSWRQHVWLKGHTEPVRSLCFASLPPALTRNDVNVMDDVSSKALVTGGQGSPSTSHHAEAFTHLLCIV